MSIGRIDEIQYYFNENYRGYFEKFILYNFSHEFYRGYATFIYTTSDIGVMGPALHIYKKTPRNLRWLLIG